jgi:uncharacterized protein
MIALSIIQPARIFHTFAAGFNRFGEPVGAAILLVERACPHRKGLLSGDQSVQTDTPGSMQSGFELQGRSERPGGGGLPDFAALDERVIWLWRFSTAIGYGILLFILLVATVVVGGLVLEDLWRALAAWAGLALLAAGWAWWYPGRAYRAWGYRLDGQVLELRSGVWFRIIRLLPLSRLQHVDLHRGPLERALGLASLVLHTAGTQEAAISIPGLEETDAVRLRDTLVSAGGDDGV